jgi:hypothetical protein
VVSQSSENKAAPQNIVLHGQEMANSEQTSHQLKSAKKHILVLSTTLQGTQLNITCREETVSFV